MNLCRGISLFGIYHFLLYFEGGESRTFIDSGWESYAKSESQSRYDFIEIDTPKVLSEQEEEGEEGKEEENLFKGDYFVKDLSEHSFFLLFDQQK